MDTDLLNQYLLLHKQLGHSLEGINNVIISLYKENEQLKVEIDRLRKQLACHEDSRIVRIVPIDMDAYSMKLYLNDLIGKEKEGSTFKLLQVVEQCCMDLDYLRCEVAVNALTYSTYTFNTSSDEIKQFEQILHLFQSVSLESQESKWLILFSKLLYRKKNKGFAPEIMKFLDNFGHDLLRNATKRSNFECLMECAKLFYIYEKFQDVAAILRHLNELAGELSIPKDSRYYYRLYWYAFTLEIEHEMADKFPDVHNLLQLTEPEAQLYRIYNLVDTDAKSYSSKTDGYISTWKSKVTYFNMFEKDILFPVYDRRFKSLVDKLPQVNHSNNREYNLGKMEGLPIIPAITQIKTAKEHCPDCKCKLVRKPVNLVLYKKKMKVIVGYVMEELPRCSSCNAVFLTGGEINNISRGFRPNYVKTTLYPGDYPPKKKVLPPQIEKMVKKQPTLPNTFAWPSTEVKESTGSVQHDNGNFKDTTALYNMGYKITGTNRRQRWEVLEKKAVPNMSLRDIAYIIANNIRLRKAQIGGKEKYAHAIAEWEYDLKLLKEKYYRSNFSWPTY